MLHELRQLIGTQIVAELSLRRACPIRPGAVVAAIAAWVALGEHLDPLQIAGGVVVLIGIAIAQSLRPTAGSV